MKLTIEYPVLTSGIPFRTSKERLVMLTDSAEFDIPEFLAAEVPEVGRMIGGANQREVTDFRGYDGSIYSRLARRERVEDGQALSHVLRLPRYGYRIDDEIWSPLNPHYQPQLMQMRFDNASGVDSKIFPSAAVDIVAGRQEGGRLGRREDYRFNSLDEAPFDLARVAMFEASRDLVLVDGELWRRSHFPVIAYAPQSGGMLDRRITSKTYVAPIHVPMSEVANFGAYFDFSLVYGALDVDEGFEAAFGVARRIGGEDVVPARPEVGIQVFDPSYFSEQDATPIGLLHCAHKIRDNLSHGLLRMRGPYDSEPPAHRRIGMNAGGYSTDALLLLHAISNEIAATDMNGDYGRLASLVRQASDTPEAYSIGKNREQESLCINASVDLWENRPIAAPSLGSPFTVG